MPSVCNGKLCLAILLICAVNGGGDFANVKQDRGPRQCGSLNKRQCKNLAATYCNWDKETKTCVDADKTSDFEDFDAEDDSEDFDADKTSKLVENASELNADGADWTGELNTASFLTSDVPCDADATGRMSPSERRQCEKQWTIVSSRKMTDFHRVTLKAVEKQDCISRCCGYSWCVSFDYNAAAHECYLSDHRPSDAAVEMVADADYEHFTKNRDVFGYSAAENYCVAEPASESHLKKIEDASIEDCAAACTEMEECYSFQWRDAVGYNCALQRKDAKITKREAQPAKRGRNGVKRQREGRADVIEPRGNGMPRFISTLCSNEGWSYFQKRVVNLFRETPEHCIRGHNAIRLNDRTHQQCADACAAVHKCISFDWRDERGYNCALQYVRKSDVPEAFQNCAANNWNYYELVNAGVWGKLESEFVTLPQNAAGCGDLKQIRETRQCRAAAKSHHTAYKGSGSWANMPSGCHWDSKNQGYYFNRGEGSSNVWAAPVCALYNNKRNHGRGLTGTRRRMFFWLIPLAISAATTAIATTAAVAGTVAGIAAGAAAPILTAAGVDSIVSGNDFGDALGNAALNHFTGGAYGFVKGAVDNSEDVGGAILNNITGGVYGLVNTIVGTSTEEMDDCDKVTTIVTIVAPEIGGSVGTLCDDDSSDLKKVAAGGCLAGNPWFCLGHLIIGIVEEEDLDESTLVTPAGQTELQYMAFQPLGCFNYRYTEPKPCVVTPNHESVTGNQRVGCQFTCAAGYKQNSAPECDLPVSTEWSLRALSSAHKHAGTGGGIDVEFLIDGEWTAKQEFFRKAGKRSLRTKRFTLGDETTTSNCPTKVRLSAINSDGWHLSNLSLAGPKGLQEITRDNKWLDRDNERDPERMREFDHRCDADYYVQREGIQGDVPENKDCSNWPCPGTTIILKNTTHKRYVRMKSNTDMHSVTDVESASKLDVVDAGNGEIALWSQTNNRWVRMNHGKMYRGMDANGTATSRRDNLPDNWSWERFLVRDAGKGQVAFWSKVHYRFIRMHKTDMDRSGYRDFDDLPGNWSWERFTVINQGRWDTRRRLQTAEGQPIVQPIEEPTNEEQPIVQPEQPIVQPIEPIVEEPCLCTKEYAPVCFEEKTYSNSCNAKCHGAEESQWTGGECPKPCLCTKEYAPVCYNGKTYSNSCGARCEGAADGDWTDGACEAIPSLEGLCHHLFACYQFGTKIPVEGKDGDEKQATCGAMEGVWQPEPYQEREDAMNKCALCAAQNHFGHFALHDDGECLSSATAGQTYANFAGWQDNGDSACPEGDVNGDEGVMAVYKLTIVSHAPTEQPTEQPTAQPTMPTPAPTYAVDCNTSCVERKYKRKCRRCGWWGRSTCCENKDDGCKTYSTKCTQKQNDGNVRQCEHKSQSPCEL